MAKNPSKFPTYTKIFKIPLKVLTKARDMYVNSMTSCAGKARVGVATQPSVLPRSFSVNSTAASATNEEELRELIRVATARTQIDLPESLRRDFQAGHGGGVSVIPKSRSLKIGRIDEDKPFDEFDDDVKFKAYAFLRSRSCTASTADV